MAAPRVMTSKEVRERLGVSQSTAQRFADDGRLIPLRRSPRLYDADDVDKLAAEIAEELRERLARLEETEAAS